MPNCLFVFILHWLRITIHAHFYRRESSMSQKIVASNYSIVFVFGGGAKNLFLGAIPFAPPSLKEMYNAHTVYL